MLVVEVEPLSAGQRIEGEEQAVELTAVDERCEQCGAGVGDAQQRGLNPELVGRVGEPPRPALRDRGGER